MVANIVTHVTHPILCKISECLIFKQLLNFNAIFYCFSCRKNLSHLSHASHLSHVSRNLSRCKPRIHWAGDTSDTSDTFFRHIEHNAHTHIYALRIHNRKNVSHLSHLSSLVLAQQLHNFVRKSIFVTDF